MQTAALSTLLLDESVWDFLPTAPGVSRISGTALGSFHSQFPWNIQEYLVIYTKHASAS